LECQQGQDPQIVETAGGPGGVEVFDLGVRRPRVPESIEP
jgi:hypothetical protein